MRSLTREDVVSALGLVDDMVVTEVVSTGATADELAEAKAWLASDEPLMNVGRRLPAGRVGQLIEVLRRVEDDEEIVGPAGHRV